MRQEIAKGILQQLGEPGAFTRVPKALRRRKARNSARIVEARHGKLWPSSHWRDPARTRVWLWPCRSEDWWQRLRQKPVRPRLERMFLESRQAVSSPKQRTGWANMVDKTARTSQRQRLTRKQRKELGRRIWSNHPGLEVVHRDAAGIDIEVRSIM